MSYDNCEDSSHLQPIEAESTINYMIMLLNYNNILTVHHDILEKYNLRKNFSSIIHLYCTFQMMVYMINFDK
jgi:hypothetical protein